MCSPFTDSGNLHLHACHHQCRLQSRKGVWLQNEGISTPCITMSASQLNKGSRDELNSCLHLQVQMPQRSNSEMVDVLLKQKVSEEKGSDKLTNKIGYLTEDLDSRVRIECIQ